MAEQLDPSIIALSKAIREQETGNRPLSGGSGENGRYQWMPGTWQAGAQQYLGDANAPMTLENENKVAYNKIKAWKDAGKNPAQIASLWNSGGDDWRGKVGVNSAGIKYDTPSYVKNVFAKYKQFNSSTTPPPPTVSEPPKEGFFKELAKSAIRPLAEVGTSAYNLGKSVEDLAFGRPDKAAKDISATRNLPFLGQTKPAVTGTETTGQMLGKSLKYGSDIAGYATGGKVAATTLGEGLVKGGILGATQFGGLGALGGLGGALEKKKSATAAAADTLFGGLSGGLSGGAIGGLLPLAAWGTGAVAKAGQKIFDRVTKPLDERVTNVVNESLSKALKPAAASLKNPKYMELANKAVRIINQFRTSFPNEAGEMVQRAPKTRQELLQSLRGAKDQVFSIYNNIAKAATGRGAQVDVNPIANELIAATQTDIGKYRPEISSLLLQQAEGLKKMGPNKNGILPGDDALKFTQQLNSGLQSFFARGNTGNEVSGKAVDAFVVGKINEFLDKSIESTAGVKFAPWKKAYQALKTIEKDVTRGAATEARKAEKNFFDLFDLPTAFELVNAITHMSPVGAAKAGVGFGLKRYYKYLNDPNTYIKKMFKALEDAAEILPAQTPNVPIPKP